MEHISRSTRIFMGVLVIAGMTGLSAFAVATRNANSWTQSEVDNCVVNLNGASATVTFNDTTAWPLSDIGATLRASSSGGTFAGDYIFAGVQSVNFNLVANAGVGDAARVQVRISNGNVWSKYNLVAGVNSIGFGPSDGWVLESHASRNVSPNMQDELKNVVAVGVRVQPYLTSAQEVTVSAFSVSSAVP
ncbi:MAG: hypothetical protein O3C57_02695, partial [Verrucomicrobia bacterium]|nr:hypothetical protein [Verrucomicrobiota bacterium]